MAELPTTDSSKELLIQSLPPEEEEEVIRTPNPFLYRSGRSILLLLLIVAVAMAAGSFLLHRTLDPRPFLTDVYRLIIQG